MDVKTTNWASMETLAPAITMLDADVRSQRIGKSHADRGVGNQVLSNLSADIFHGQPWIG